MDREIQSYHLRWLKQDGRCSVARAVPFVMLALQAYVGDLPGCSEINHLCESRGQTLLL
jgi:hypothetical protein